jgi:hypothetical protein
MRASCLAALAVLLLSTTGRTQTIHIQAVRVSDDDGSRPARVTAKQFKQWVDFANRCYAPAGIEFLFSQDEGDFATLKSTAINNMAGKPGEEKPTALAHNVAMQLSDKIVVFCRYGPGKTPIAGAFSSQNHNFVMMPGFTDAIQCGHPSIDGLAHEIGHYLYLPHTFARHFADVRQMETYLKEKGNNPTAFDGDGLDDTAPDPYIGSIACDPSKTSLVLNGITFALPRRNIMSYYTERDSISPKQAARVRWALAMRMRHGMVLPTNQDISSPIEAEAMKVIDKRDCGESVQDMSSWGGDKWSARKQLFCRFGEKGSITLLLHVSESGPVQLNVYATYAPDYGKVQILLDGKPVGEPFNAFAPVVMPSGRISLGRVDIKDGDHKLRLDVVGKDDSSTGYTFGIDCVELVP